MWRAGSPGLLRGPRSAESSVVPGLGRAQVLAKVLTDDEQFGEYFSEQLAPS